MDETTFWQMIEQAKADSGGDGEEQVRLLVARLAQLEIHAIVQFDFLFDSFHARACRRDVWEAGDIAHWSGLSDDGFSDFRAWLIAQGEDAYELVLADPDSLAQIVKLIDSNDELNGSANICLERMNYVARNAYREKTGSDAAMPRLPFAYPQVTGSWNNKTELPLKYPQLWAVFGRNWE